MDRLDLWFVIVICICIALGLNILNWCSTFIVLYRKNIKQICLRYPKAVILTGLCFSTQLCITSPVGILINGILLHEGERYITLDIFYSILNQLTLGAMSYMFAYRVYMIYFDIKWNLALQDSEWQLHIDANLQQNKSWFIRKKKTFGNSKTCSLVMIVVWLMFFISYITTVLINGLQTNQQIRYTIVTIQWLIPLIFFIIISCKLPKFNDIYLIRKEIKTVVITWILYLIVGTIISLFVGSDHGTWGYAFVHLRGAIWMTILCYIQFPWIFKQFDLPTNIFAMCINSRQVNDMNNMDKFMVSTPNDVENAEKATCFNILKDDTGFRAFANYLSKSWAIENLLFILEIFQFKNKLKSIFKDELSNIEATVIDLFEITANSPTSTLVNQIDNGDNDSDDIKDRVCICLSLLFMKYIVNEAYFSINISYDTRCEICDNFGYQQTQKTDIIEYIKNNKNEQEFFLIFDKAVREICDLLQIQFYTFQSTNGIN